MFDEKDRTWLQDSIAMETVEAEVFFVLKEDFYKGDEATFFENQNDTLPLQPPAIAAKSAYQPVSLEVLGKESELAVYYKSVLELARKFGKKPSAVSHHFWLRMFLRADDTVVGFPWYDTWTEMLSFLDWLSSSTDGATWWDIEQGWETAAICVGPRIHIREGDGEDEIYTNVSFPRDEMLVSAAGLKERMPLIISRLTREVGADYWTKHWRY